MEVRLLESDQATRGQHESRSVALQTRLWEEVSTFLLRWTDQQALGLRLHSRVGDPGRNLLVRKVNVEANVCGQQCVGQNLECQIERGIPRRWTVILHG